MGCCLIIRIPFADSWAMLVRDLQELKSNWVSFGSSRQFKQFPPNETLGKIQWYRNLAGSFLSIPFVFLSPSLPPSQPRNIPLLASLSSFSFLILPPHPPPSSPSFLLPFLPLSCLAGFTVQTQTVGIPPFFSLKGPSELPLCSKLSCGIIAYLHGPLLRHCSVYSHSSSVSCSW